jgi:hypothetical protein
MRYTGGVGFQKLSEGDFAKKKIMSKRKVPCVQTCRDIIGTQKEFRYLNVRFDSFRTRMTRLTKLKDR